VIESFVFVLSTCIIYTSMDTRAKHGLEFRHS
jgi:hypothetical protein